MGIVLVVQRDSRAILIQHSLAPFLASLLPPSLLLSLEFVFFSPEAQSQQPRGEPQALRKRRDPPRTKAVVASTQCQARAGDILGNYLSALIATSGAQCASNIFWITLWQEYFEQGEKQKRQSRCKLPNNPV